MLKIKPQPADLWIQSASGGEAYLAWEILKLLDVHKPIRILLTTNTDQGMEVLEKAAQSLSATKTFSIHCSYFPFDQPSIMQKAVEIISPKLMVLLETEIWPGLMLALKQRQCPVLIINGRITQKSLRSYRLYPRLWPSIKPNRILAMSALDAERFANLFQIETPEVMYNIKFDRFNLSRMDSKENALDKFIYTNDLFVVLGSVRKEEETDIMQLISLIKQKHPHMSMGLFPRHMHRVESWITWLSTMPYPWILRSKINQSQPSGTIIIWDTFGELGSAYHRANAAFVGGSLAPLGGQNFLEPLSCGVIPVIGPYWDNFAWVGTDIIKQGLLKVVNTWEEVAHLLCSSLSQPDQKEIVFNKASAYIKARQGGTQQACSVILDYLN
ncbi:MAG: 3-deoxy-D-manno-octulosonic acid transferase [Desulfobacterales bacterium]|nr:3-deoxy-D-manno-octulosonic acid transferase [Desulfobacterales bacterium]